MSKAPREFQFDSGVCSSVLKENKESSEAGERQQSDIMVIDLRYTFQGYNNPTSTYDIHQ